MGKPKIRRVPSGKPTKLTRTKQAKPKAVSVHMSALRGLYRRAETALSLKAWVRENDDKLVERYLEKYIESEEEITYSPKAGDLLSVTPA